ADDELILGIVKRETFRNRLDGIGEALLASPEGNLSLLGCRYIAPGAHNLNRLTVAVTDQVLLIDHPAIGSVLLKETAFDRIAAALIQARRLRLHTGAIIGVNAAPPEFRVLEILLRFIAEPIADILANEGRGEIASCLETIDDGRGAGQKVHKPFLCRDQRFA